MIYSDEDWERIFKLCCTEGTDDDRFRFRRMCERTDLDPLCKQIWAVFRNDRSDDERAGKKTMAVQTSIDGFRLIAQRSGKYCGQRGPYWCSRDGKWMVDSTGIPVPWNCDGFPFAAMVGVLHADFKEPIYAIARWDTYCPYSKDKYSKEWKPTKFWKSMPDLMLGKVAEALGLRRAFPLELSGLYTDEEMAQADHPKEEHPLPPGPKAETPPEKPKAKSWKESTPPERFAQIMRRIEANKESLQTLEKLHEWLSARKGDLEEKDYNEAVNKLIEYCNALSKTASAIS